MTRRLIATYLILAAAVLVALEIPLGLIYQQNQRHDLQQKAERDAVVLATLVEDRLERGAEPGDSTLASVVDRYSRRTDARAVVVSADGQLLADSDSTRPLSRNFSTRPEIASAVTGSVATGTRRSNTLGVDLLYVAVPVASGGVVHGAVRTSVPTSRVDALVLRYWLILGLVALLVLGAVALVGRWLALWVSRPVTHLRDVAIQAETGDLAVRANASEGPEEVQELSRAFNDMISRLGTVLNTQEQFVADASHQLRSPLFALRLRIENLAHEGGTDMDGEAEGALAEVDRLSRLVDGLLALARADRVAPERTDQDVGTIVRERAEAWRFAAAEQRVEITTQIEDGLHSMLTDGALDQVLDNLVANALDVVPPETGIRIGAKRSGERIEISLEDEGPGMPQEAREHAFDRFWQGAKEGSGSGLGLAIVKSLVEADGGTITLEEAPGGGLLAVIGLPAAASVPSPS